MIAHSILIFYLKPLWNSQVGYPSPRQHLHRSMLINTAKSLNHPCVTSCNRDGLPGQGRDVEHNDPRVDNHRCVNAGGAAPAVTAVPEESEGPSLSGLWPRRGQCQAGFQAPRNVRWQMFKDAAHTHNLHTGTHRLMLLYFRGHSLTTLPSTIQCVWPKPPVPLVL